MINLWERVQPRSSKVYDPSFEGPCKCNPYERAIRQPYTKVACLGFGYHDMSRHPSLSHYSSDTEFVQHMLCDHRANRSCLGELRLNGSVGYVAGARVDSHHVVCGQRLLL